MIGRTLEQLSDDSLRRAAMEAGDFSRADELTQLINQAGVRIHTILATMLGREYLYEELEIAVPADSTTVSVGGTMSHLVSVDRMYQGEWTPMGRGHTANRTRKSASWDGCIPKYLPENWSSSDPLLRFFPPPSADESILVGFVPSYVALVNTSDILYLPQAWHEWVSAKVAISLLLKEDSDIRDQMAVCDRIEMEIEAAAATIDLSAPTETVSPNSVWDSVEGMY